MEGTVLSSSKSTAHQMGLLYSAIVLIFLAISTACQIEHPEWGLVTTAILFGPSQRQTIRKALFRFLATVAAGIFVLLITAIAPSQTVATLLVLGVLITGHLAIRFPDWAYYNFVFGVTLGILSVQTSSPTSTIDIGVTIYQRIVQIGLATIITVPILFVYLGFIPQEETEHQARKLNASTHSEFLIRATLCASILGILALVLPINLFVLIYLITVIFVSASAVIRDLSPIFKAAFVGASAAVAVVLFARGLWLLLPDVTILKIFIVSILFGGIKTCSLSSQSWSMAWELVLIFAAMLLAIEISSESPTMTYLLIMLCLIASVGILATCQIIGKLLTNKLGY